MPSLRVLCVVLLAGLGAVAAGLGTSGQHPVQRPVQHPVQERRTAQVSRPDRSFDVRAENARPGATNWRITSARGSAPGLQVYAARVSVRPGQRVDLHIDGSGPVLVRAFRIGWYGGAGARDVWRHAVQVVPSPGHDPSRWPVQVSAQTRRWPPGQYLIRLDLGRASRYVPLTVRSLRATGQMLTLSCPQSWRTSPLGRRGFGAGALVTSQARVIQFAERDRSSLAYTCPVSAS